MLTRPFRRWFTGPSRPARHPYSRPGLELLEDRTVPTLTNFGNLCFSGDLQVANSTQFTANGGTVLLGFKPAASEDFQPLLQFDLTTHPTPGVLRFDTNDITRFEFARATVDSVVQGGALPIWQTDTNDPNLTTWAVAALTGANGLSLTGGAAVKVHEINFTLTTLLLSNPGGGTTEDAEVKMQGTATFPQLQALQQAPDLSRIQAKVDGDNYLIASTAGTELTGLTATLAGGATFDVFGMAATLGNPSVTYTHANGVDTFKFSANASIQTKAQDNGQQRALDNVGAGLSVTLTADAVTDLGFDVSGSFHVFFLGVESPGSDPVQFDFNFASRQYEVSGAVNVTVPTATASTVGVVLGYANDPNAPGLVIKDGELTQLNAELLPNIVLSGLRLSSTDGVTFLYDRSEEQFEMYGNLKLNVPSTGGIDTVITAQLGSQADPGLVVQNGSLRQINLGLSGQADLFGLVVDVSNAGVQYSAAEDTFEIQGTISVPKLWHASVDLLPGKGIVIDHGQFHLKGVSFSLSDANVGVFTVQQLKVTYSEGSSSEEIDLAVDLFLVFPGGWGVFGDLTLIDNRIDSITLGYTAGTGDGLEVGDTGLFLTYLEAEVQNIDDPHNLIVSGNIAFTYGPTITLFDPFSRQDLDVTLFAAAGGFTIDRKHLVLDGRFALGAYYTGNANQGVPQYRPVLAGGTATLDLDWADRRYEADVSLSWYDGIIGVDGVFAFDEAGDVVLAARAELRVPHDVPFIGGKEIGEVDFLFVYHADSLDDSFVAAWTDFKIPIIDKHIKIGIKYDIRHSHLSVIGGSQIDAFDSCFNEPDQCLADNGQYLYYSSYQSPSGATSATFTVSWPYPASYQTFSLTLPDGTVVQQDQFPDYNIQVVPALTTYLSLGINISSSGPDVPLGPGAYTFSLTTPWPFPNNAVPFSAVFHYPEPTLNPILLGPIPTDGTSLVDVTLSGTVDEGFKDKALVSLYVDVGNDTTRSRGAPVKGATAMPITTDGQGNWTLKPTWDLSLLSPNTTYYLYAVIHDGVNQPVTSPYSAGVTPVPPLYGQVTDVAPGHGGAAVPGLLVYLDTNEDGQYTVGDPTSITDAQGTYEFWDVTPNVFYYVGLIIPDGFQLAGGDPNNTNPRGASYFGSAPVTADFGLIKLPSISGTVFNDFGQDGQFDPNDTGLGDWLVYLDTNGNGARDADEATAVTAADGTYSFLALDTGTYTVRIAAPSNYFLTSPPSGTRTVTILRDFEDPDPQVTGQNFGALAFATISGTVTDTSGAAMPGWPVQLYSGQAIDAGGASIGVFRGDNAFSGGQTAQTTAPIDTTHTSVGAAPEVVYQSNRYGKSFAYTVTGLKPNALLETVLHFAETYWDAAGQRVFNVSVNGEPRLTNFDIFATAGGKNIAVTVPLVAAADAAGNLTFEFSAVTDNAQVNGIEALDEVSFTSTDSSGNYRFGKLFPGTYTVTQLVPPGTREVAPFTSDLILQSPEGDAIFQLPFASAPTSVAVADFDADGKNDFAVLPNQGAGTIFVYYNGDTAPTIYDLAGNAGVKVVAGDFLGTGRQDLAVLGEIGEVTLLRNQGDSFQVQPSAWFVPLLPGRGAVYDMARGMFLSGGNGDQLAVLYLDGFSQRPQLNVAVLYVDPTDGQFLATVAPVADDPVFDPLRPGTMAAADINGDGQDDVIIGLQDQPPIVGYPGNQTFLPLAVDVLPPGQTVVVGDVNGDGLADLGVFDQQALFHYAVQDQDGDFTLYSPGVGEPGHGVGAVVLRDVNGDLRPDLVWVSEGVGSQAVSVALNTGQQGQWFTPPQQTSWALGTPAQGALNMAVADLNGDGLNDLLVSDAQAGAVELVYNRSQTVPTPYVVTVLANDATGNDFVNLQVGQVSGRVYDDLNRDGTSRLSEPGRQGVLVYLDLNHDGKLDPGEPATRTTALGHYSFAGLPGGTYLIRLLDDPERQPTAPAGGAHEVDLTDPSQSLTDLDFGTAVSVAVELVMPAGESRNWTVRRNGDRLEVLDAVPRGVFSRPLTEVRSLKVVGTDQPGDSLTIDLTAGGFFTLPGGVTFDGLAGAADMLAVKLGAGEDAVAVDGPKVRVNARLELNRLGVEALDLAGGPGDDTYDLAAENTALHLRDRAGVDTIDFGRATTGVNVVLLLDHGQAQSIGGGNLLRLDGTFENLYGTAFADVLLGNLADNLIRGRGGNDVLVDTFGNNILLGGDGNDVLMGGIGRDLLLGGLGADVLYGGLSDDLLIGGTTAFDDDERALRAILAEWASPRSYEERVRNLIDGQGSPTRANGESFLNAATVFDDHAVDVMFGGLGRDWFLSFPIDLLLDRRPDERVGWSQ